MDVSLLFKSILSASFMGSIVAVILILIKILFKDKLSARWHYCIWFLLILKLILPFAPESQLSVFNLFPHVTPNVEISQIDKISEPDMKNLIVDTKMQDNNLQTVVNQNVEATVKEATKVEKPIFNSYLDVTGLIWMIGAGILLLYIFILNITFYLSIRKNSQCFDETTHKILEECKSLMKVKAHIPVIYSESNRPPFLLGIFRPRLIVPHTVFDKLSLQEKRYIFLHEITHLKRKDILVNSVMLILKSIHWFNPIIWYSCYKMQEDCEIACDARVLSHLEPVEYKRYGETAIDLLKIFSKSGWIPGTAGISGNGKGIRRRIHMIARYKKNSLAWTLVTVILFLIVGVASLTNSSQMNGVIPIDKLSNEASADIDVEGEGVVITLADKPGIKSETNIEAKFDGLVCNSDISTIVKDLRTVGTYAISVNDIRLTKYSRITGESMLIIIDNNKLKPPYVIKALGNSEIMEKSLNDITGGAYLLYLKYRGIQVKFEKVNDLLVSRQGEEEKLFHETIAEMAKNVDIAKKPDEISPFKEYWAYGFYGFWTSPYVIYNNHKYEILVQDSIPSSRAGKELGNLKNYFISNSSDDGLFWQTDGDVILNGVNVTSFIRTGRYWYSNYLHQGAKIYELKWNSSEKVIVVNDNGVYKRAIIAD